MATATVWNTSAPVDIHIANGTIRIVNGRRPALMPLLRSENQLRMLSTLLLAPAEAFTVGELATRTGIPQPSVSREVAKLLTAGILRAGADRGRKVVQADTDSPIFPELAGLLLKMTGPKVVLERLLEGVAGITAAYVYGSWARRYISEAGPEPADIDLLVIGTPSVQAVRARAEWAGDELGRDVNVSVLTEQEWQGAGSGYVQQIRAAPLVALDLTGAPPATG